ncbi:MAG: glycosyltransferase family 4 protein [Anaerolineae bacterium]|nr:glycosyltransferase family 4 protein [Anaerolineae bacterium]
MRPDPGGVQTYLHEVASRLQRRHDVLVITPVQGLSPDEPYRRLVRGRSEWLRWWLALKAWSPDRVLVGHAHPRLLALAAMTAWGRYAALVHGNDFLAAQRRWHRPGFNMLLRRAHPLMTQSQANRQRLRELGLGEVMVIPPGVDPERFRPRPTAPPLPPCLLTVGRLVPRKGIDTVLRALALLQPRLPQIRYQIVGDGPDRGRLEALVETLDLSSRVDFVGHVPDEALPDYYRNAHIFVMPAREEDKGRSVEGFGIVYLEASASGLPVVAGRSGGAVEAVRAGETGLLVDPDAPHALAEALWRLLQDEPLRHRLGRAGRAWVESEMNWERVALALEQALCKGAAR